MIWGKTIADIYRCSGLHFGLGVFVGLFVWAMMFTPTFGSILWVFWFGLLGGATNALVDVDHYLAFNGFRYTDGIFAGRPLHIPLLVIAGLTIIFCVVRWIKADYQISRFWASMLVVCISIVSHVLEDGMVKLI